MPCGILSEPLANKSEKPIRIGAFGPFAVGKSSIQLFVGSLQRLGIVGPLVAADTDQEDSLRGAVALAISCNQLFKANQRLSKPIVFIMIFANYDVPRLGSP